MDTCFSTGIPLKARFESAVQPLILDTKLSFSREKNEVFQNIMCNTNFAFVCQFKDLDMFKAELVEFNLELVSFSQENLHRILNI